MAIFYKVGGCVRDELLGLSPKDIDYSVECESFDSMRQAIIEKGGEIFLETPQYFTIRAKIPKLGCADFVLCRKDGLYSDGRRPDSVEPGKIFDDLARRDLTVNAIAINCETGEIIDPYYGRDDINRKILRFVGNANERLREDKLRAFRIVRFSITKDFRLFYDSAAALYDLCQKDFENVSTERIREEILKMFQKDSIKSFKILFEEFPILGEVIFERGIWFKPTIEKIGK